MKVECTGGDCVEVNIFLYIKNLYINLTKVYRLILYKHLTLTSY